MRYWYWRVRGWLGTKAYQRHVDERAPEFWHGAIMGHYRGEYDAGGFPTDEAEWAAAISRADELVEQRYPGAFARIIEHERSAA